MGHGFGPGSVSGVRSSVHVSAALLVGAAVFLLNDVYLDTKSAALWLVQDYASRSLVVAACLFAASPRGLGLGRPTSIFDLISWTVFLLIVALPTGWLMASFSSVKPSSAYPAITSVNWLLADTLVGIPLVALSEELLARGIFHLWACARNWRGGGQIIVSASLFAAFHWSLGSASVMGAGLFGLIAMFSLLVTRSLWPCLLAHCISDWILLSYPQWHAYLLSSQG